MPLTTLGHFVGGSVVEGRSNRAGDVYDPATGEVERRVAFATAEEVGAAVAAARAAFADWSETPPLRRANVLFRFRELALRDADRLAALITAEHGKTLADARGEVQRGLEVVEFACGIPHLLKGDVTENVARDVDSTAVRQPLGVCAGITPFNFPAMVPMWMLPIALAGGNTFVLKPSEKDPSLALETALLLKEAGLPDGVFNVVNGDREAVDALLEHPGVAAISFVGSTPVAEHVYRTGTANGKRVQALGGAKNHLVVMPDADLDQAVDALMGAAFGSAGERCMAISVAVAVGDATADPLVERLRRTRARACASARGRRPASRWGRSSPASTTRRCARTSTPASAKARDWSSTAARRATRAGGTASSWAARSSTDVTPAMRIYHDEIFGPVLGIVRVDSIDEALRLCDEHPFGNGVAIFTRDGGVARTFAHRVQVGMVGINVPIPVPMAFHSFGGWKRSIFGDHAIHGAEGVRFYTRLKTITTRWPETRSGPEFTFPTSK